MTYELVSSTPLIRGRRTKLNADILVPLSARSRTRKAPQLDQRLLGKHAKTHMYVHRSSVYIMHLADTNFPMHIKSQLRTALLKW